MGTANMGTANVNRDPYGTQAAAGYAPTAGTMPGTTHQQFGGHTGATAAHVPPTMGQPDQRLYNTQAPADPRLEPTTGQKVSVCNILSIV